MKIYIAAFAAFLFLGCANSSTPTANNAAVKDPVRIEKNKQTALLNQITETTQAAQKLEKQGRDMEALRQWSDAESRRQCGTAMEERQKQVTDLAEKIKTLPPPFASSLTSFVGDLQECVSCSKTAMPSCVKARASINKAIGEIYAPR